MQTADIPPSQTLYVNNLNEKIKIPELKRSLYHVFSQFGEILEVMAKRTYKMRGQAWVVFADLAASTRALREMNNFSFYGKNMRVQFAKEKSDVVSKADGTFKPRPKRKSDDSKDEEPKHMADLRKKRAAQHAAIQEQLAAAQALPPQTTDESADAPAPMEVDEKPPQEAPNKILFVQNLPDGSSKEMLRTLFKEHEGLVDVRTVSGKSTIAFVEFENEVQAGKAMDTLQNFRVTPTHLMKISYAKK